MGTITQARLKELLDYDPLTGIFRRLTSNNGGKIGEIVGTAKSRRQRGKGKTHLWTDPSENYLETKLDGKKYLLHRLAWLYVNGTFGTDKIDHKDRNKHNNSIDNLRVVSNAQNMMNATKRQDCTSIYKGVSLFRGNRWKAVITVNKKSIFLKTWPTEVEAAMAYNEAAIKYFGEYAHLNEIV